MRTCSVYWAGDSQISLPRPLFADIIAFEQVLSLTAFLAPSEHLLTYACKKTSFLRVGRLRSSVLNVASLCQEREGAKPARRLATG